MSSPDTFVFVVFSDFTGQSEEIQRLSRTSAVPSRERGAELQDALFDRVFGESDISAGSENVLQLGCVVRGKLELAFAERVLNARVEPLATLEVVTDPDDSDLGRIEGTVPR